MNSVAQLRIIMAPYTSGFSPRQLRSHYQKHRRDFPKMTISQYANAADQFLGGPRGVITLECRRSNGEIVRFNIFSQKFGVLTQNGRIKTYYMADRIQHKKLCNICYFWENCR